MRFFKYSSKRKKLKSKIQSIKDLKIVIGSGNTNYDDWISTDMPDFDITNNDHWKYYFKKNSIHAILAEHVFEHLNFKQVLKSLALIKDYLKPGGVLRIAVPDGNHPSRYVRDLTKAGGLEPGADDHKIFFDLEIVKRLAIQFDFELRLIEYFDEDGFFHSCAYDFKNGYISRCLKNYSGRFTNSPVELERLYNSTPEKNLVQIKKLGITYTSLFFDLIKK